MKPVKSPLVVALIFASSAALAQEMPLPGPRPFEQMRGDCADFAMDVARETAAWASAEVAQVATTAGQDGSPVIPTGQLTRLALHPHGNVTFAVAPEQDRGGPEKFSGHLRVTVPHAGLWRVAASNGLWFDAVLGDAIVPTVAFEMQTQCRTPFKVVVFDLPAGEVALQFNGSATAEVEVIVLPWAGH